MKTAAAVLAVALCICMALALVARLVDSRAAYLQAQVNADQLAALSDMLADQQRQTAAVTAHVLRQQTAADLRGLFLAVAACLVSCAAFLITVALVALALRREVRQLTHQNLDAHNIHELTARRAPAAHVHIQPATLRRRQ